MSSEKVKRRHWAVRWLIRGAKVAAWAVGVVLVVAAGVAVWVWANWTPAAPGSIGTRERVDEFARVADRAAVGAGLVKPAELRVHWSGKLVPFVAAGDDLDLAFGLGLVHAHLRLGQMEILRRLAQGRLSESAGPVFVPELDQTIRTIDFVGAAKRCEAAMRPSTRAFAQRYADGINAYVANAGERPVELRALGIEPEPWTVVDVLTLGRLAGSDVNWFLWFTVLRLADEPEAPALWGRLKRIGDLGSPSFGEGTPLELLNSATRAGSNAFAVAGWRTASGSAIVGTDPHVGLNLPPLWVVVGVQSPDRHAVGMMIPGIPAFILGRNESLAWGGTNMRALSTALYDATKLPGWAEGTAVSVRKEKIAARWWWSTEREIRETAVGPLITDSFLLSGRRDRPVAFAWRGRDASDELTGLLDGMRAGTLEEFRAAMKPYAVGGANFLIGDKGGRIGHVLALDYDPAAGATATRTAGGVGDPSDPAQAWGVRRMNATELPASFDPPAGFLVSSNNEPVKTDPPVTLFANENDRQDRLTQLLRDQKDKLTLEAAQAVQRDVYSISGHRVAKAIVARVRAGKAAAGEAAGGGRLIDALAAWDGRFTVDSHGAAVQQAVVEELFTASWTRQYGAAAAGALMRTPVVNPALLEELETGRLDDLLPGALARAAAAVPADRKWGDVHRLRLTHWLGSIPVLGRWYQFGTRPIDGSSNVVAKTANSPTSREHLATFGQNSRFLADLSDPDANLFVLLGGNDGWLGSVNALDQVEDYVAGRAIRVPLREGTFQAEAVGSWRAGGKR